MFGQNYRPVMVLGVVPSRCRLNTAVCGRSKYFFLVTEHFQVSRLLFFRVGSPVDGYWFQKHQPSRSTMVTKRGRDVIRNPDVLLQIDKGQAHPKKHVCFDKRKKHISDFCCRPLCIAPVQFLCKVIGDWPLRVAGRIGTCTTHTCSERLLVGEKAKPLIFARKRESCFPKAKHTWNWNERRTKQL